MFKYFSRIFDSIHTGSINQFSFGHLLRRFLGTLISLGNYILFILQYPSLAKLFFSSSLDKGMLTVWRPDEIINIKCSKLFYKTDRLLLFFGEGRGVPLPPPPSVPCREMSATTAAQYRSKQNQTDKDITTNRQLLLQTRLLTIFWNAIGSISVFVW